MDKLFEYIEDILKEGREAVLAMIIAASGSTPRGAGAKMLVLDDGSTVGTIGGGRAEYLSVQKAAEALKKKLSFTASYDMSQKDIEGVGMICGGRAEVCFKYFSQKDIELVSHMNKLILNRSDAWLIIRISDNAVDMGTYDRENGVMFIDGITGEEAEGFTSSLYSFEKDGSTMFVEQLSRKGTVYIFGAGHVSKELAPLLSHLDFHVKVYEQRKELADAFPSGTEVINGRFNNIDEKITMTAEDYAVIMTSGHSGDFEVLEQVLRKELSYVGVIGSRTKIAITKQRLLDAGIKEGKINTLHTPIGLAIKAVTPAEIAVSVAAELILHRAEHERGEKNAR
ncbi:MAG: xanthine dehydrogenase accessory protein XdhC [Clostridia bacterium]|nr:xanthine dehydrogenase accessory protein XdhC [Clostridia bacterium]